MRSIDELLRAVPVRDGEASADWLKRAKATTARNGAPPGRRCEWCGVAIAGHTNRRTCSPAHRKALSRAGGVGPFSAPDVTPSR